MKKVIIRGAVVSLPEEVVNFLKLTYENDKHHYALICKVYDESLKVKVAATKSVMALTEAIYDELNKFADIMHFE